MLASAVTAGAFNEGRLHKNLLHPVQTIHRFAFAVNVSVVLRVLHVQLAFANRAFFDSMPVLSFVIFLHATNQRKRGFKVADNGLNFRLVFGKLRLGRLLVFVTGATLGELLQL